MPAIVRLDKYIILSKYVIYAKSQIETFCEQIRIEKIKIRQEDRGKLFKFFKIIAAIGGCPCIVGRGVCLSLRLVNH
jgi:hypothetical protein